MFNNKKEKAENKADIKKEETKNELEKKSADDIAADSPNSGAISSGIEKQQQEFRERVRDRFNKTYTGNEVNEFINIILEEADLSIDKAYKEGYKQATVELKPEIEYWKTLYNETQKINRDENIKKYLISNIIGLTFGCALGGVTGFSIGININ